MTIPLAELRNESNAVKKTDDRIPRAQIAELAARRMAPLDHDGGIHPLALDLEPLATVPHPGAMVARRVEIVGGAAIDGRRLQGCVALRRRPAAEREKFLQEALHHRGGRRREPHL